MKPIYSPIIPKANKIVPANNKFETESIATPKANLFQKNIFVITTTKDNIVALKPSVKPKKVIILIGFLEEVTIPNTPKSIRNDRFAELEPIFDSSYKELLTI